MFLNQVMVIGNLTRDPELKSMPNGGKVTNISIATNRSWTDKNSGQKQEEVEFHNIVIFGRQAETVAQYLKKGSNALVKGRLKTRSWDDTATGTKKYRTEIIAENVQFGAKATGQQSSTPQAKPAAPTAAPFPEEDINPEDIPF